MERDGSKELASQRQSLRSQPSSEGLWGWGNIPPALPQGDALWLAPSAICMRQAPRKRSGPGAHFVGILKHLDDIIAQTF